MKYKYQLHTHTSPPSRCGVMSPRELVLGLVECGYSGALLTNHFYGGNTGIDRGLEWEKFVRAYEDDYIECSKIGEEYDIDILFSVEEHIGGGKEIICLGVTPKMLYEHPTLMSGDIEIWHNLLHGVGGLIIQAHPFRERAYISEPGPLPLSLIDGIEVYNFGNTEEANELAGVLARKNPSLILSSGADAHSASTLMHGGIATNERLRTIEDLIRVLKSGDYELILE